MSMPKGDLDGLTIVVTRPNHQAEGFCRLIEAEGGTALRFPVIDIQPPVDTATLATRLQRLDEYQLAIFISVNAVEFAYRALGEGKPLPETLQRAAVGQATAKALASHAQPAHWVAPAPYNSEALLAMPEFSSVAGKRILIFRGAGGREYLAETLEQRGAQVDYAECYRREIPHADVTPLVAAWQAKMLHLFVVTSNEALHNLLEIVGTGYREYLLATPLVVISQRTADLAKQLGFGAVLVSSAASDAALLAAIKQWANIQTRRLQA
jgi:uroporphyrinogen-III synthase